MLKLNELLETVQLELPSRCGQTRHSLENLPAWFRDLARDEGIAALEGRVGHTLPEPLRSFYRFPATACWLQAHADTDISLDEWPLPQRPHLVRWYYRPHLVIAALPHSQLVLGVELDADNPRIEWGDDGAKTPLDYPSQYFVPWLTRIAEQIIDSLRQ